MFLKKQSLRGSGCAVTIQRRDGWYFVENDGHGKFFEDKNQKLQLQFLGIKKKNQLYLVKAGRKCVYSTCALLRKVHESLSEVHAEVSIK